MFEHKWTQFPWIPKLLMDRFFITGEKNLFINTAKNIVFQFKYFVGTKKNSLIKIFCY